MTRAIRYPIHVMTGAVRTLLDVAIRGKATSIDAMLDQLYLTADSYLNELANKSGGRLVRADTLGSLPDALRRSPRSLEPSTPLAITPSTRRETASIARSK